MGQSSTKLDSNKGSGGGSGSVQERPNGNGGDATSQTRNQKEKPALGERRQSFYETVDASEVLPYLIIGKFTMQRCRAVSQL